MSATTLIAELDERIKFAEEEASDSHKAAMNSYGAGYDAGYLLALRQARHLLVYEEWPAA